MVRDFAAPVRRRRSGSRPTPGVGTTFAIRLPEVVTAVGGAGTGQGRRLEAADGTPVERPAAQRRRVARARELTLLLLGI